MHWKTCATDVSPIVQHVRFGSIWENLISASVDCAHVREAEAFFSRRPCPCDDGGHQHTGTEGPLLAQDEHAHAVVGCPLLRDERTQMQASREERVLPLPGER